MQGSPISLFQETLLMPSLNWQTTYTPHNQFFLRCRRLELQTPLTRHNPPSPTLPKLQKLQPSVVVVVEAVAVGIIVVVEEIEAVPDEARRQTPPLQLRTPAPDIREPSTLTSQKGSGGGVRCTSDGVVLLSFVQSRVLVHGRTSTPPSHPSEAPANSSILKTIKKLTPEMLMTRCTV